MATIANHLAIALVVGFVARSGYDFGCFYERSPFGSACDEKRALTVLVDYTLATACVLYASWGVILLVRYLSE